MKKNILFLMVIASLFSAEPNYTNAGSVEAYVKGKRKTVLGWCSEEKTTKMVKLVIEQKPEVCVEIGVYGGSSIFPTAAGLKYNTKGKVYAIDPWSNEECTKFHEEKDPNKEFWGSVNLNHVFQRFRKMLRDHRLTSYCKILRMTSEEALAHIPMEIDILHIDGNHQEEACYFDTTNYFPRVKVGGYIWFDDAEWYDTIQKKHTTRKSLNYLLDYCELVTSVDQGSCVLLKKLRSN